MNWREQLRPASFRGVPFLVKSSDQTIGRRTAVFEYPGRDQPFIEDMGGVAWSDTFEAYVLGADHMEQAARLTEALNKYGPGELVHPYLGTRQVQAGEGGVRHSDSEGGQSVFSIKIFEAPPATTPNEAINTDIALQESCDEAEKSLLDEFDEFFAVEGMTQGLVDELATAYDTAMEAIAPGQDLFAKGQNLWAKGQGYMNIGTSWIAKGQNWVGRVADITKVFSNPSALGGGLFYGLRDFMGVFGHVGNSNNTPKNSTPSGSAGLSTAPSTPAPATPSLNTPTTPPTPSAEKILDVLHNLPVVEDTRIEPVNLTESRKEQKAMQGALLDLMHSATVIAAAQASSLVEYQDQAQAEQVQEVFIAAIERAQERTSDTVFQHLEQVRVDLIKDLSSRGAGLPSVTRVTPAHTLPALVQAYRLYGDSRRAEQLVDRNRLSHPGFVPAGQPLEVLQ